MKGNYWQTGGVEVAFSFGLFGTELNNVCACAGLRAEKSLLSDYLFG